MRLDKNDRPRVRSRIGFHMFRHMCASLLFEHGMNIVKVSRWLGHADPAFTLRTYVHTLDDGLGDVAFLETPRSHPRRVTGGTRKLRS